jgi:hypothetical protein
MQKKLLLCASVLACLLVAAEPVAVVTAGPGLKINGKAIETAGAPNWPIATGDEVVTTSAAAVVTLRDGGRVTMAPNTKLVIIECDRIVVQLFEGTADYNKPEGSKLEFCALGHPIRPAVGTQGSIIIENGERVVVRVGDTQQVASGGKCSCDAGAPWARSHKRRLALIILGLAGAGAGTAVTVTRPGNKSP